MSKMNSKQMLAGALVACGLDGIVLESAWTTASNGLTTTMIAGPTPLG